MGDLISRLMDESDLCGNEGATDLVVLLDEAVEELTRNRGEIQRAFARMNELERDAGRYRYWRDKVWCTRKPIPGTMMDHIYSATFDAAIDAAMKG